MDFSISLISAIRGTNLSLRDDASGWTSLHATTFCFRDHDRILLIRPKVIRMKTSEALEIDAPSEEKYGWQIVRSFDSVIVHQQLIFKLDFTPMQCVLKGAEVNHRCRPTFYSDYSCYRAAWMD